MFKVMDPFTFSRLCLLMKEEHFSYGQTLFKIGDPIQKVYIIRSGSFKLMRKICLKSSIRVSSKLSYKVLNEEPKNV